MRHPCQLLHIAQHRSMDNLQPTVLQRAYEMCKEAGGRWTLCSINPGAIWGPPLSNRLDGESINQCLDLLSGVMWPCVGRIAMGMVDVRDVARAHVAAMENPAASGRYLINAKSGYLLIDAMRILRQKYPKQWVPCIVGFNWGVMAFSPLFGLPRDLCAAMLNKQPILNASKAARDLGMTTESYVNPEVTISEMADALMEKQMVPAFRVPVILVVVVAVVLVIVVLGVGLGLGASAMGISLVF
eukprot:GHRR01013469.1.p1 GENE.GHRR01013469.1~~GHRR01013469.1.p1  ORF type:complete len:243 (+),score=52.83 GHRR01013469.1:748-1476(+)